MVKKKKGRKLGQKGGRKDVRGEVGQGKKQKMTNSDPAKTHMTAGPGRGMGRDHSGPGPGSSSAGSWGPHRRDPMTLTPQGLTDLHRAHQVGQEAPTFNEMRLSKARSPPPLPPYISSVLDLNNSIHFTDMNRYGHQNAIT